MAQGALETENKKKIHCIRTTTTTHDTIIKTNEEIHGTKTEAFSFLFFVLTRIGFEINTYSI